MSKVFYHSVITRLSLLHLLYDIEKMWGKTLKHAFSMFYTLIKHGFSTNQSRCKDISILQHSVKASFELLSVLLLVTKAMVKNIKTPSLML